MSPKKPTLKVVPKGKPATHAEVAQIEFRALKEFRNLTATERAHKINDAAERVRAMAILASGFAAKSKLELIALAEEQYELLGPFLMQLSEATTAARALADVLGAGEARLAIALANVEEDDAVAKKVAAEADHD
jgi:hypothetical protein